MEINGYPEMTAICKTFNAIPAHQTPKFQYECI